MNDFYTMYDWYCFKPKDMVNWAKFGPIFSLDDISWADDRAWASQAVARNGKYYLYCPVHKKDGGMAIAVGVSDCSTGLRIYGGVLMAEGKCFTNHPEIADFKGHSYLFYHTDERPGGSLFHRSVCVAEFKYNEDSSITTVDMCSGVEGV